MEYGKLVKCLSKFVAGIVSAAIVFTLVPKILGTNIVRALDEYDLWVGGVQVNSDNKDDILNDGGSARFDSDTYTLTFNEPENLGCYNFSGSNVIVYIGDLGHDISICGKAELVSADAYTYAVLSNSTSVTVTFNGEFSSEKSFVVDEMVVLGGKIETEIGIQSYLFSMHGGEVNTKYYAGIGHCSIAGGTFTANNDDTLINSGSGIACNNLIIYGGTVNSTGVSCGISTMGSLTVIGGDVLSQGDEYSGIYSGNKVDISGGKINSKGLYYGIYALNDITISNSTELIVANATSEADSAAIVSKNGTITVGDKLAVVEFGTAVAAPYDSVNDAYDYSSAICSKPQSEGGWPISNATITDKSNIFTVTYKSGDGFGSDITERKYAGQEFKLREFPSIEWSVPSGKHFYRWLVYDFAVSGEYMDPLKDYKMLPEDATMTAIYVNYITGWEDTGDGGVNAAGVYGAGLNIATTSADYPMVSGDGIGFTLKDGYILKDNRLDFVSASSGTVVKTVTMTAGSFNYYHYGYDYSEFNEDVYLRFTTQLDTSTLSYTVTWKAGDGTGTDITETAGYGDKVYYKDFPSAWTEPADGRHFDGWLVEGTSMTPHYEYCSGGWTPGIAYENVYEDITCTAKYKYWITGYEDTGDNGIKSIGDPIRGLKPSGSDVCAAEGDNVVIELELKDGFSIADNKIEVLSAKTGKVITSFTLAYYEMSDSFTGTFTMPGEDVTLRFATKDKNSSTTTANTYTVVIGGDGEWDGISDYVIEVKSSADDEHCIDRFLWAAVDGHELVVGKECLITKGSTIVTIKSDYLKSLGEGTHNVVVNFKDNSVATTLVVKAAGTQSAASVPATGEGLAPTLFIGGTFVIAAAGFIGIAIMKKRKES